MKSSGPFHLREIWLIMFFLGMIMLNFPFVHIFNKEIYLLDFPLLFLYFMVGWPVSIFVVYLFSRNMKETTSPTEDDERDKGGP